ncbi:MAG: ATP-binding cassette domain-containing protein [Flavobacteriia bacterium]|nr:ATP-binding cassette domain-containing protein [Flavobacteriia bacterium]
MEKINPVKRLFRLLKLDKKEISQIYLYSIFIGLLNLSLPLGIQAIVNYIQAGQVSTSWIVLVILVVLGIILAGVMQVFQLRITENIQQKIFIRSSFEFAYRIPRFNLKNIQNAFAPELVNRFFDTMTIQKGLPKMIIDFSTAILQLFFGLILLSIYHPFFIVFSSILLVALLFLLYYTGKQGLSTAINESKYKYKVAYWLEELARTMNSFKLVGNSPLPLERTNDLVELYIKERESHFKVIYRQFAQLIGFKSLIALFLLLIGGFLVIEQQINIGQFIAAEIIILLVINSVEKIIINIETMYDVLAAIDKIGMVTDIPIEEEGGKLVNIENPNGHALSIKNLSFQFSKQNDFIFKNFNLEIQSGQHTAVIGDDGSGKTTLLHLIGNLFPLNSGSISFNNVPSVDLNLEYLRSTIGDYVSEQRLFMGTIEENITMNRPGVDFNDLLWACEKVKLMDYIQCSKKGFSTYIDPNGKSFSRSVTQKILLARCIVNRPKLLLMDDQQRFTSNSMKNVDHLTELLFDLNATWTLIATTKNEQLLKLFKQIIKLDDGKIVFQGSYAEYQKHLTSQKN